MEQKESVIVLRSLTHSIKAKKVLQEYGIASRVVKPSQKRSDSGCGYGIAVSADKRSRSEAIIRENGIDPLDLK
jgi:hypothetical protein